MANPNPLEKQIGGEHYTMPIQPIEFCFKNQIPYIESSVIKYLCRWRTKHKGSFDDLLKALHLIEILIELETQKCS